MCHIWTYLKASELMLFLTRFYQWLLAWCCKWFTFSLLFSSYFFHHLSNKFGFTYALWQEDSTLILFGFLVSFIEEILTVFFLLILFILSAALCKVTLYVLRPRTLSMSSSSFYSCTSGNTLKRFQILVNPLRKIQIFLLFQGQRPLISKFLKTN